MITKLFWGALLLWAGVDGTIKAFRFLLWGLRRYAEKTDDPKKALILSAVWGVLEVHGIRVVVLIGKMLWQNFRKGNANG